MAFTDVPDGLGDLAQGVRLVDEVVALLRRSHSADRLDATCDAHARDAGLEPEAHDAHQVRPARAIGRQSPLSTAAVCTSTSSSPTTGLSMSLRPRASDEP